METYLMNDINALLELQKVPIYKTDQHWSYCNAVPRYLQGWKIYVSCSIATIDQTMSVIIPILAEYRVPFKYCNNLRSLELLNAGMFGYSQIGKAIVIYAEVSAIELMAKLKMVLASFKGSSPVVPFAMPIGDDLPLFYRYGSYCKLTLDMNYGSIPDLRNSDDAAIPLGVADIFQPVISPPIIDQIADHFICGYPVISTISQNGKSGTFIGLNIKSEGLEAVVLKIGYKNGAIQRSSLDGYEYVLREIENYHIVRDHDLLCVCPRLIDSIDTGSSSIIVTEHIDGYDMLTALRLGGLTQDHLWSAWEIINALHDKKCIINDPKLSNFMIEHISNRVLAIDLEMLQWSNKTSQKIKKSFCIDSSRGYSEEETDKLHFLASIFLSLINDRPESKVMINTENLKEIIKTSPKSEVQQWAYNAIVSSFHQ